MESVDVRYRRDKDPLTTAIFLGAGASKADGALLQWQLFPEYFSSQKVRQTLGLMDGELAEFFRDMFLIDVDHPDVKGIGFPIFEEVLALTDLAIIRKEAFRNFDLENRTDKSGRLRRIGQYLVFLVAAILNEKLKDRAKFHRLLVKRLVDDNSLRKVVFVSTNYDILIDNALTDQHGVVDLDYGIDFRNIEEWDPPRRGREVRLYKPHGSLNWLLCGTCGELDITPKEKGVVTRMISANEVCRFCRNEYSPLIVPPTFYKDLNNVFLSSIWNQTETALRQVNHVIFCGYSFADADVHVKYLLKRAQTNRDGDLKFTVVNRHEAKTAGETDAEKGRYQRFLGPDVNYTNLSFEEFARDPIAVLQT
jgi:hypothetical protein